jgi:hypothetical protein
LQNQFRSILPRKSKKKLSKSPRSQHFANLENSRGNPAIFSARCGSTGGRALWPLAPLTRNPAAVSQPLVTGAAAPTRFFLDLTEQSSRITCAMWRIQNLPDAIARQPSTHCCPHLNLNIFKPNPPTKFAGHLNSIIKLLLFLPTQPAASFLPSLSLSLPATETGRGEAFATGAGGGGEPRPRDSRAGGGRASGAALAISRVARPGGSAREIGSFFCGFFPGLFLGGVLLGASVDSRRAEVSGGRFEAAGAEIPRGAAVSLRPVR